MLDGIMQQVQGQVATLLKGKANLTSDQLSSSMEVAKDSVSDGLKDQLMQGNFGEVMNLFKGGSFSLSNPIVADISKKYVSSLISKVGLSESVSKTVSDTVIPMVLQHLGGKATQEGGLNAEKLMGMLGGSSSGSVLDNIKGNVMGKLGGLFG